MKRRKAACHESCRQLAVLKAAIEARSIGDTLVVLDSVFVPRCCGAHFLFA